MNKQNLALLEEMAEKKQNKRAKKNKPKMKIAGASVKGLQKIIVKKATLIRE
jgi:hypothetical protein